MTAVSPMLTNNYIVDAVSSIDWDFSEAHTGGLTHGFHPYPAKFIPQISNTLIDLFTEPGDTVADVFCGSGTTLVEAVRRGRNALGVDANPLAALIGRVKCRPLSTEERNAVEDVVKEATCLVREFYALGTKEQGLLDLFQTRPDIPNIPDLDFWFPKEAQNELALIRQAINACPLERAREFVQVAFSAIVVAVSYQDSDTRYTRRDKGLKASDTLRKWRAKAVEMLAAVRSFDEISRLGDVCTLAMDARCIRGIEADSVRIVITSPPYPNAYSYHLYHRFRMEWLGYDQPRFKQEEIGSHRKYSAKGDKGATADTFRAEMEAVLRGVERILVPAGLCVMIVGDSTVRGEKIDNAALIQRAGTTVGLNHLVTLDREIHSGKKAFNPAIGNIKREHLVFLRKP